MSPALKARIVPRTALDAARRREMCALMSVCYEGVVPERFESDLDQKQHVILLFAPGSELVGFSTLRVAEERLGSRTVDVVYSGDTVIHPAYWGAKTLQAAFVRFVLRHRLRRPWRPCFWLLLSGGYKTYLLMARHLPRGFPSRRYTPDPLRGEFLSAMVRRWFGDRYDPGRGVVRFDRHYRVRRHVAPVDATAAADPDVAYFLERNPGHVSGDELVCLAELGTRDLLRVLLRVAWLRIGRLAGREPERVPAEARS